MWGSEFTTKDAPEGGSADFGPRLNVKFELGVLVQPSLHLFRGQRPCKVRYATHLPSTPPSSYGHRFQLAEGTSSRRLTCHCTHKAAYYIFPAAQLPSCLLHRAVYSILGKHLRFWATIFECAVANNENLHCSPSTLAMPAEAVW